jgi:hypothetical protein
MRDFPRSMTNAADLAAGRSSSPSWPRNPVELASTVSKKIHRTGIHIPHQVTLHGILYRVVYTEQGGIVNECTDLRIDPPRGPV